MFDHSEREISWKTSLLVIAEISGLFANTFTVDDKYSLHNRENLPKQNQMQLSQKPKSVFSIIFCIYEIYIKL